MRFLLDTHTLLWASFRKDLLSSHATQVILTPGSEILVSAASAWEIATKYRIGKLPLAGALLDGFVEKVTRAGYHLLSVSTEHALRAGLLPGEHKDPFDRMIAAQSIHENLPLLSQDSRLDVFGVRREW
jgi:PIN domain nuclease of toxin-antitoxin system